MLTRDQIADIQGFQKVYQDVFKSVDAAAMATGLWLWPWIFAEARAIKKFFADYYRTGDCTACL